MFGVERSNGADYEVYCLSGCYTAHCGGSLLKFEHIAAANFGRSGECKQENLMMEA